jgi:hypothetical protein
VRLAARDDAQGAEDSPEALTANTKTMMATTTFRLMESLTSFSVVLFLVSHTLTNDHNTITVIRQQKQLKAWSAYYGENRKRGRY